MEDIFQKQLMLQRLLATKHNRPKMNISEFGPVCKGDMLRYVADMQEYIGEEVKELKLAIGNDDRDVLKPWSSKHLDIINSEFETSDFIKDEAIDILCFVINICLAIGIKPADIGYYYNKKWERNIKRHKGDY